MEVRVLTLLKGYNKVEIKFKRIVHRKVHEEILSYDPNFP